MMITGEQIPIITCFASQAQTSRQSVKTIIIELPPHLGFGKGYIACAGTLVNIYTLAQDFLKLGNMDLTFGRKRA